MTRLHFTLAAAIVGTFMLSARTGINGIAAGIDGREAIESVATSEPETEEKTYTLSMVEEKPHFPGGGESAMFTWISTHVRYPASAVEDGAQGKVVVQFTIDTDGSIKNAEVVRSLHPDLDKEALRVVKTMPKWTPGKNNGTPVKVIYRLPITFKM